MTDRKHKTEYQLDPDPRVEQLKRLDREQGVRKLLELLPPPDQLTLENPKPKPIPTPTHTITVPGANWMERRLTDVKDGIEYAKYLADKNKITRWLFDTRDVALPPAGNDWEWDMFHPKNYTSKLPDSRIEDLMEWFPNIYTSVATNTDDFINSKGGADAALEGAAATAPFGKALGLAGTRANKALTGTAFADYVQDTREGHTGDPVTVYEAHSKHTKPPKKPEFGNYRKPRTVTLPK